MENEEFLPADECCVRYNIELSFIQSLHEFGLIEISTIESRFFIAKDRLPDLEKFIHLHYELDINMAGLDAIHHLLEKVKDLQHEILALKNKLNQFE